MNMNENAQLAELLAFFKALSDANRLKIVGLLAQSDYSVEELAAILALGPSTISHHLARLAEVELVSARAESYYNVYRLETGALQAMARRLIADETLPEVTAGVDLGAYDRQVVENYAAAGGRLRQIPSKRKKFESILRYVARAFEPGRRYTEKEVNDTLSHYHEDTAILRRGLVDYHLMARESDGTEYWLV
jgi:hypothetical protein